MDLINHNSKKRLVKGTKDKPRHQLFAAGQFTRVTRLGGARSIPQKMRCWFGASRNVPRGRLTFFIRFGFISPFLRLRICIASMVDILLVRDMAFALSKVPVLASL